MFIPMYFCLISFDASAGPCSGKKLSLLAVLQLVLYEKGCTILLSPPPPQANQTSKKTVDMIRLFHRPFVAVYRFYQMQY